jgi:hypothetical protein
MSDHLPVVAEFYIGNLNSTSSFSLEPNFSARVINPVTSNLLYEIKTNSPKNLSVNLYSVLGEKVFSENISVEKYNQFSSNVSNLTNGIYILTFEGEGIFKSYRIVKSE